MSLPLDDDVGVVLAGGAGAACAAVTWVLVTGRRGRSRVRSGPGYGCGRFGTRVCRVGVGGGSWSLVTPP